MTDEYERGRRDMAEEIAFRLDQEATVTPCKEDAIVVRDCATLVRANFSYADAERMTAPQSEFMKAKELK